MVLVYVHALDFAEDVYKKLVQPAGRGIDFEMSIDEVATPTTPQDHFFVANELIARVSSSAALPQGLSVNSKKGSITSEIRTSLKLNLKSTQK